MNGISLAALLGASAWFGSKFTKKDAGAPADDREIVQKPADSDLDVIDHEDDRSEFYWPPGPLFQ